MYIRKVVGLFTSCLESCNVNAMQFERNVITSQTSKLIHFMNPLLFN